jgi:hypothetical protein
LERRLAETLNALAAASSERDAKAIEVGALQTRLDETTAALVVSNEAATKVSKTASDANTKLVKTLESDMENASQALRVVDLANDALVGEVEQVLGLYQIPTLFAHKRLTLFFHNHSCARSSQRR